MGRGNEILYQDLLLPRRGGISLSRRSAFIKGGADIFLPVSTDKLLAVSLRGQAEAKTILFGGQIVDQRYVPDCQSPDVFFAHSGALIWSEDREKTLSVSLAPRFLQKKSFTHQEEGAVKSLCLSRDTIYALFEKEGRLSLKEHPLFEEGIWENTVDGKGDDFGRMVSFTQGSDGMLFLHEKEEELLGIAFISSSGEKKTWEIERGVFDFNLKKSLLCFSYGRGSGFDEFYFLDESKGEFGRLRASTGSWEPIAALSGRALHFSSGSRVSLILYDDRRLDLVDHDLGVAETLFLENDFEKITPLGSERFLLSSSAGFLEIIRAQPTNNIHTARR